MQRKMMVAPIDDKLSGSWRSPFNINEESAIRTGLGMEQLKTGMRKCLRCEKNFLSEDLKKIKMCSYCRGVREYAADL